MADKAPTRTCVACQKQAARAELVRVVKAPNGDVFIDAKGRSDGRGAYVCCDAACFAKAMKKRMFDKKLRKRLSAEQNLGLEKEFDAICAAGAKMRASGR